MRFDRQIELLAITIASDATGNQTETTVASRVFANELTMSTQERVTLTQDAGFRGYCDARKFELWSHEYSGEPYILLGKQQYTVVGIQYRGEKVWLTLRQELSHG